MNERPPSLMRAGYPWTCSACGARNERGAQACSACTCPFAATAREIDRCRVAHLAAGGTLLPGAADLATADELFTLAKVLLIPIGILLFGAKLTRTMDTPGASLLDDAQAPVDAD